MTDYRPVFKEALSAKARGLNPPRRLNPEEILEVCNMVAETLIGEAEKGWELRRKARVKAGIHPDAEKVYGLYPKKAGREDALKSITAALKKHPLEYLLDKTAQFSACVANWPSSYRYFKDGGDRVWNPVNFFNGGHYEDDPSEWKRHGSRMAPPPVGLPEPEGWRFAHPESRFVTENISWAMIDRTTQQWIIEHTPKQNTA